MLMQVIQNGFSQFDVWPRSFRFEKEPWKKFGHVDIDHV